MGTERESNVKRRTRLDRISSRLDAYGGQLDELTRRANQTSHDGLQRMARRLRVRERALRVRLSLLRTAPAFEVDQVVPELENDCDVIHSYVESLNQHIPDPDRPRRP
jgi:hypothetical protein